MTTSTNQVPTWYGDIQKMFTSADIGCMQATMGNAFNLGSYQFVEEHSSQIYQVVASGYMPKGGPAWPQVWVDTFRAWVAGGYQEGTPPSAQAMQAPTTMLSGAPTSAPAVIRLRKDIRSLDSTEIALLTQAFQGLMARDPSDPQSYFQLAGIHWLPAPNFWCMHHDPAFLTWHRAYQIVFEDALRTVPGCESITLPYWDITMQTPLPDWLYAAPFDTYTFQADVSPDFPAGYQTSRFPASQILANLQGTAGSPASNVFADVARAMAQPTWEGFNGYFADADYDTLIAGHDNGHNDTGLTMQQQDIAAFDPIFWFFHGNWDRVFWEWQKAYNATTQAGMLQRIANDQTSYDTFTDPVAGQIAPFTAMNAGYNSKDLLNLADWNIEYAPSVTSSAPVSRLAAYKSVHAADLFSVNGQVAHVRVNGVNRLKIPGSFSVRLMSDGVEIGNRPFFQPSNAPQCPNCVKNAIAHFDFKLPLALVIGGKLSLSITMTTGQPGKLIPLASLGNPTIEVRLPLSR